jgi:putative oxidoreductase
MKVVRNSRIIIRFFEPIYKSLEVYAYPLIRFVAGAMMIPHGYGKVFGGIERTAKFFSTIHIEPSLFFAWYVGLLELVGGICVAIGLLTRFFSAQLIGLLFVATFIVHFQNGFSWAQRGYEYPLFWMLIMVAITIKGGERLSMDNVLPKEF